MTEKIRSLLEQKDYETLAELFAEQPAADIAAALSDWEDDMLAAVFRLLPKALASAVYIALCDQQQEGLLYELDDSERLVLAEQLLAGKKFAELRHMLVELNPTDVAQLLEELPPDRLPLLYRLLPKELAVEVFVEMDGDNQKLLIRAFSDRELKEVIDELYLDDTVDIIEEMPATVVKRILRQADPDTRMWINKILHYPRDSAGSIMTIEYVDLKQDLTVADAFARIRRTGVDKETIYTCYVTDENRKLLGLVTAKDLLLADQSSRIGDIMETNIIYVTTLDDKEYAAKTIDKYDFLALPVVDQEERLVGIVTVDDAMDVIQEENTEDFSKMAAITPSEDSYFKTSVFRHARNRILWLLVLMLSATLTGLIIDSKEQAIAAIPALVSFIPMLMNTGGNCGSQSSTLIIRGLSLDEIRFRDIFRVMFKEARIALLVSVVLAVVNGVRIYIMNGQNFYLALVVSLTLILTVILSKLLGGILPMLAKKCRLDPAIMAAPLITTVVDTCSVLIYFTIAGQFWDKLVA